MKCRTSFRDLRIESSPERGELNLGALWLTDRRYFWRLGQCAGTSRSEDGYTGGQVFGSFLLLASVLEGFLCY